MFQRGYSHSCRCVLTNRPKCFSGDFDIDIGDSDFHNYVFVASRAFALRQIPRKITYIIFVLILIIYLFMSQAFFGDIDDIWWAHNQMFLSVLNKHISHICTLSYGRRFYDVICWGTYILRTNEIKLRGKIMLDWEISRKIEENLYSDALRSKM